MTYEKLPKELQEKEIFCLWKYEKDKNDRLTKPPYSAVTGKKASVNRIDDFTCFDVTLSKIKDYEGLGIKLIDNLMGIDIDHCIKNGVITDWAKEIIEHFPKTYIEYSPSKTGLHILMKSDTTFDKDKYYIKRGNIEVCSALSTNRYLTVTGDVYQAGELSEDYLGLNWLLEKHMKRLLRIRSHLK